MRAARAVGAVVVGAMAFVSAGTSAVAAAPATVARGDFVLLSTGAGTTVAGRAQVVRGHDRTLLTVHLTGLVKGATYGVHLHDGPCAAALGHYQHTGGGTVQPKELWASSDPQNALAGVTANAAGNGQGRGDVPWRAAGTARSVVVHNAAGTKLACADLS